MENLSRSVSSWIWNELTSTDAHDGSLARILSFVYLFFWSEKQKTCNIEWVERNEESKVPPMTPSSHSPQACQVAFRSGRVSYVCCVCVSSQCRLPSLLLESWEAAASNPLPLRGVTDESQSLPLSLPLPPSLPLSPPSLFLQIGYALLAWQGRSHVDEALRIPYQNPPCINSCPFLCFHHCPSLH